MSGMFIITAMPGMFIAMPGMLVGTLRRKALCMVKPTNTIMKMSIRNT